MSLIGELREKLPDCFPHLCSHYANQVTITGKLTSPADAFAAWSRWLTAEGGVPERPLTMYESPEFRAFHERAALAIREVAITN
jgi:hypothetical protein